MLKKSLSFSTAVILGVILSVSGSTPANADVTLDTRPCITRAEWEAVDLGWTRARVVREFDSSPDFTIIRDSTFNIHRHNESYWRKPGICKNGEDVLVMFRKDRWGRWIAESKCWDHDFQGDDCVWNH